MLMCQCGRFCRWIKGFKNRHGPHAAHNRSLLKSKAALLLTLKCLYVHFIIVYFKVVFNQKTPKGPTKALTVSV